jgi:hypothetical protein
MLVLKPYISVSGKANIWYDQKLTIVCQN